MNEFGVTPSGFNIKPFTTILEEKADRAREIFGANVDLRPTSPLRKLLDITSLEDHELWKKMERLYFGNFISTAEGEALDLLGEDLGVTRRHLHATGSVTFSLSDEAPGRLYQLPVGTLVQTGDAEPLSFRTLERATLSDAKKEATVPVQAEYRGPAGNAPAAAITSINPDYTQYYLNLGDAILSVTNSEAIEGGEEKEADPAYRNMLLGYPRTIWTQESVRNAIKLVDGVRDCRLFDPLGGTDVSLSKFNLFRFATRKFGVQRELGSPYFFDALIAVQPGFQFENNGSVAGIRDNVMEAITTVRPLSIFPNLIQASEVHVGLRGTIRISPGYQKETITASIYSSMEERINTLGLGDSVRYAEVLCDIMEIPGVVDVQQLHLRKCPSPFNTIKFGVKRIFRTEEVEMNVGENVKLDVDEIAVFKVDSELIALEVVD